MPVNREKLIQKVQTAKKELQKLNTAVNAADKGILELRKNTSTIVKRLGELQKNIEEFKKAIDKNKNRYEELKSLDIAKIKEVSEVKTVGEKLSKEFLNSPLNSEKPAKEKAEYFEKSLSKLESELESTNLQNINDALIKRVDHEVDECLKYMYSCINFNESYKKMSSSLPQMIQRIKTAIESLKSYSQELNKKNWNGKVKEILIEIMQKAAIAAAANGIFQCLSYAWSLIWF